MRTRSANKEESLFGTGNRKKRLDTLRKGSKHKGVAVHEAREEALLVKRGACSYYRELWALTVEKRAVPQESWALPGSRYPSAQLRVLMWPSIKPTLRKDDSPVNGKGSSFPS
ncbi:hypothetical protein Leryth_024573 [Lithospermum erythrorhizon]|nr:hypothetical protein Leryth_024573 [Lithospermum erythrorhizon]